MLLALGTVMLAVAARATDERPEASGARPPDVVLITIDTLRADALAFAGNAAVETPTLDRLAATGRVFTDAHAHNVVTLPSHANILTGRYPYEHGIRDNSGFVLGADVPTLATVLRAAGYATGAFVAAFPLDSQFGLGRGFEIYDDRYPQGTAATEFVLPERRGDEVVAAALAWWQKRRGAPRFLWLHLFDPHAPYDPPEPYATRYRDAPYLGEVAAVDAFLTPLLGPLLAGGEPAALVVFTSDHGEALGEHGELTHGLFAYEATLRVPLVVWGAGVEPGRDPRPARHVDIFPTVLEAVGKGRKSPLAPLLQRGGPDGSEADSDGAFPGRSLLRPPAEDATTYFEALSATLNRGWAPLRGAIADRRKLIALPIPELYDLARDPGETMNLARAERAAAAALARRLPPETSTPEPAPVAGADAARLRSLGYLGASTASSASLALADYGPEDDPKNLVELDRMMHRTIERYSRGELDAAVALAREVVARRPAMPLGRTLLAEALLERGDVAEAIAVMRAACADGVATPALERQLGLTLAETGETREALEVLRPLAAGDDPQARAAYALALSEAGRQDEAGGLLRGLLDDDPGEARTHELLALVALRRRDFAAARDASRRALELDPSLARAANHLGVALYELGDAGGALAAWERAAALDPKLFDALYNLGTKAREHGRPETAARALRAFVDRAPAGRYAADLRRARVLLARLEREQEREEEPR